jgi:hypothetical protein
VEARHQLEEFEKAEKNFGEEDDTLKKERKKIEQATVSCPCSIWLLNHPLMTRLLCRPISKKEWML